MHINAVGFAQNGNPSRCKRLVILRHDDCFTCLSPQPPLHDLQAKTDRPSRLPFARSFGQYFPQIILLPNQLDMSW